MTKALNQIIFGKALPGDEAADRLEMLGSSDNLAPEETLAWWQLVSLEPMPVPTAAESQTVGLFSGPGDNLILARAHVQNNDLELPVYQYVLLPRELLSQQDSDLPSLLSLVAEPIPIFAEAGTTIDRLEFPPPNREQPEDDRAILERLQADYGTGIVAALLRLLGAALNKKRLLIRGFPGGTEARVLLVQGLMALLPPPTRLDLTFATHVTDLAAATTRIIFSEASDETSRWIADFGTESSVPDDKTLPGDDVLASPYVAILAAGWKGEDVSTILEPLEAMLPLVQRLTEEKPLSERLTAVAERYQLDMRVSSGEEVPLEILKTVLTGEAPPEGALFRQYVEQVLHSTLKNRDADAADLVAAYMDADPALDEALNLILNDELQDQPDSVYVFIRTRLSDGIDERWLPRLKAAAVCSLEVALNDGDSDTLVNWLRLISREPASYDLGDVLHEGILAAQARAHEDGDLGWQLIMLAIRRDTVALDSLLEDSELVVVLPDEFGGALRDYDGPALESLLQQNGEIFLVALARATEAQASSALTPQTIEQFWTLYTDDQPISLPERFQPETILHAWAANGIEWLPTDTLQTLLTRTLADEQDELFFQIASGLGESGPLFSILPAVFEQSERSMTDVLDIVGQLQARAEITAQQALDTYIVLLVGWDWPVEALPIVEQCARMIQQNQALEQTPEIIWRLLSVADETQNEPVARAALRRLLVDMAALEDDTQLLDRLARILGQLQWSSALRQYVANWWREFTGTRSLVQLQSLDKALEGKRSLERVRTIVQTGISIRKMMGTRTLKDLAAEINTTFGVLEAIASAFDPTPKHPVSFDPVVVRADLDQREGELSPQERKVLAKNLIELAQLITAMAENRSKANLRRSSEDVERQLLTGEQQPHSAIDTLKWMSGYLDGAQDSGDDVDEQ